MEEDSVDQRPQRRSVRLKHYDYSQTGYYFVTICVLERKCIFGEIVNGEMQQSVMGIIVEEEWQKSAVIRPLLQLDEFVVMPNHFHGIVLLINEERAHSCAPLQGVFKDYKRTLLFRERRSLSSFIAQFKATTTRRINKECRLQGNRIWQSSFHDRILRDEDELNRAREYVFTNPSRWNQDRENPFANPI